MASACRWPRKRRRYTSLNLVVTGGGTGGHVFPALEVALGARASGWNIQYLGSLRGQEAGACARAGVEFHGAAVEPLYRIWTLSGLRSLVKTLRATRVMTRKLAEARPDVVFSTGGYASGPVVQAARRLRLPFVIHEQNSVPGRVNRLMANQAAGVCTVFHNASKHFPPGKIVRTGMPIRAALRDSAQGRLPLNSPMPGRAPVVMVMGGSQGSATLNDAALATAVRMASTEVQWLHVTGLSHYESTLESIKHMAVRADYTVKPFLEAEELAPAFFASTLVLCRSGAGTLSEMCAFRKPGLLVPYPFAYAQHQLRNAQEFESMGAADVIPQADLSPAALEGRILAWLSDEERVQRAQEALQHWDVPDSVPKIVEVLATAARGRR